MARRVGELTSADEINSWVSKHTRGKITEIVTPESVQNSDAILVNAIYFNGKWSEPFPGR